jgi:hypothetical protein
MDAKKIIQCGIAGTGKSTLTEEMRKKFLAMGFGVLIYDIKNEKCYQDVPLMPLSALKRWNGKGEYKVSMLSDDDFDIVDVFKIIRDRKGGLRNFLFVLEDSDGYIYAGVQKPIRAVIGACRQWGITLLANYWSVSQVPPFFAEMCNYLVVRKTNDDFKKENDVPKFPKKDLVFETCKKVKAHPSNFHFVTLKLSD